MYEWHWVGEGDKGEKRLTPPFFYCVNSVYEKTPDSKKK